MELLKGYITVPNDVTDERVWDRRQKIVKQYAEAYEKEGWKLKSPIAFAKALPLVEDIKKGESRWTVMAYWERQPVKQTFEVDERIIPKLLETGKFNLA